MTGMSERYGEDPDRNSSGGFEYTAELTFQPGASSADFTRMQAVLIDGKAAMLHFQSTKEGTRIVCGVTDLASFLSSVPRVPGITSWSLTRV